MKKAENIIKGIMIAVLAAAFIVTIIEGIQVARVLGILIRDAAELGVL
jgi:hypothetical protein